ncbi:MAG: DUF4173 domain-containing protein [Gaiellales bacterium]
MRALALLAALLAATVIPGAPPGIGASLVAVFVAAAAATTARRTADLALFGAPALVLASFPALLDARWVVFVDVLAAWVFATLAVGGARLLAPLAPLAALPGVPAILPRSSSRTAPVLRGAVIGTALAIPFAILFLTADAAFAAIADETPRPELSSLPGRSIAFGVVFLAALGLGLGARLELRGPAPIHARRLALLEWALPLGLLDALFIAFVAVQVTVLFGGHDHVLETSGLTYAEYARKGFWQLLAAAVLTLVVVKGSTLYAGPRTRAERLLLRGLLGLLCALTIVIVASALHRLRLYESAFGLTRPRLAAEALALWLGGAFALVLVVGLLRRATALPRLMLVWAALALIGFSVANPDSRIADRNVDRWRETGRIDLDYVAGLSADATPALSRLPVSLRGPALAEIAGRVADEAPWSSANLSRARARTLLGTFD